VLVHLGPAIGAASRSLDVERRHLPSGNRIDLSDADCIERVRLPGTASLRSVVVADIPAVLSVSPGSRRRDG
jgi:hypothetical protein